MPGITLGVTGTDPPGTTSLHSRVRLAGANPPAKANQRQLQHHVQVLCSFPHMLGNWVGFFCTGMEKESGFGVVCSDPVTVQGKVQRVGLSRSRLKGNWLHLGQILVRGGGEEEERTFRKTTNFSPWK